MRAVKKVIAVNIVGVGGLNILEAKGDYTLLGYDGSTLYSAINTHFHAQALKDIQRASKESDANIVHTFILGVALSCSHGEFDFGVGAKTKFPLSNILDCVYARVRIALRFATDKGMAPAMKTYSTFAEAAKHDGIVFLCGGEKSPGVQDLCKAVYAVCSERELRNYLVITGCTENIDERVKYLKLIDKESRLFHKQGKK